MSGVREALVLAYGGSISGDQLHFSESLNESVCFAISQESRQKLDSIPAGI